MKLLLVSFLLLRRSGLRGGILGASAVLLWAINCVLFKRGPYPDPHTTPTPASCQGLVWKLLFDFFFLNQFPYLQIWNPKQLACLGDTPQGSPVSKP